MAAIVQTNKQAIQNLKQVISSTTKKLGGKKQRNILVLQNQLDAMIDLKKNDDLDTVIEKVENFEDIEGFSLEHQSSLGKKQQSTENPPNSLFGQNKFTCAGMH